MFTPTRPQRQVVATLVLLGLAVLPTILVGVWAWQVNRPGHVRDVEMELSRQLGLRVTLESVRHPRPRSDVLRGVVLRLEEADDRASKLAELARADEVRLIRDGSRLAVEVQGLQISAGAPESAIEQVEALLRRADSAIDRIDLVAREGLVTIGGASSQTTLPMRNLAAILELQPGRAELSASYRLALEGSPNRCELHLVRESQGSEPGLLVRCQVAEGQLPASVLGPFLGAEAWLGRSAVLDGVLTFQRSSPGGWEAEYRGNLENVDLASMVGDHFPPHRLTGLARVEVASARWGDLPAGQGRGWQTLQGRLHSGPGSIGSGLLSAMASEMRFRVNLPKTDGRDLAFQRLGLDFKLGESGEIELAGAIGPEFPPDTVLIDELGITPMARAPSGSASVRGLWKMLVPAPDDVLVPATAESQVFRYLPLPSVSPASGAQIQAN